MISREPNLFGGEMENRFEKKNFIREVPIFSSTPLLLHPLVTFPNFKGKTFKKIHDELSVLINLFSSNCNHNTITLFFGSPL